MSLASIDRANSEKPLASSNPLNRSSAEGPVSRKASRTSSLKLTFPSPRTASEIELDTRLLKSIATDPVPVVQDRFGRPVWGSPNNRRSMTLTPGKVRENLARLKIVPYEELNYEDKYDTYQKVVEFLDQTQLKTENPLKYEHMLEFFRIRLDLNPKIPEPQRKHIKRSASLNPADTRAWPDILKRRTHTNSISIIMSNGGTPRNQLSPPNFREANKKKIRKYPGADEETLFLDEGEVPKSQNELKVASRTSIESSRSNRSDAVNKKVKSQDNLQAKNIHSRLSLKGLTESSVDKNRPGSIVSTQETQETPKGRNYQRVNRSGRLTRLLTGGDEEYYADSPDEREKPAQNTGTGSKKSTKETNNRFANRKLQEKSKTQIVKVAQVDKKPRVITKTTPSKAKPTETRTVETSTRAPRNSIKMSPKSYKDLGDVLPIEWKTEANVKTEASDNSVPFISKSVIDMRTFDDDDILLEQPRVLNLTQQMELDTLRTFESPRDDVLSFKRYEPNKNDSLLEKQNENIDELTFHHHSQDSQLKEFLHTEMECQDDQSFEFHDKGILTKENLNFLLPLEKQQPPKNEKPNPQPIPHYMKGYLKPKQVNRPQDKAEVGTKTPKRNQVSEKSASSSMSKTTPLKKLKAGSPKTTLVATKEESTARPSTLSMSSLNPQDLEGEILELLKKADNSKLPSVELAKLLSEKMFLKIGEKGENSVVSPTSTRKDSTTLEKPRESLKIIPASNSGAKVEVQKTIQSQTKLKKKPMNESSGHIKSNRLSEPSNKTNIVHQKAPEKENPAETLPVVTDQLGTSSKQQEKSPNLLGQGTSAHGYLFPTETKNPEVVASGNSPKKDYLKDYLEWRERTKKKNSRDILFEELEKIKPEITEINAKTPQIAVIQKLPKATSPEKFVMSNKSSEHIEINNSPNKNGGKAVELIESVKTDGKSKHQSELGKISSSSHYESGPIGDLKISIDELKLAREMEDQAARLIQNFWRRKLGFPKEMEKEDIRTFFKLLKERGTQTQPNFQRLQDLIKKISEKSNYELGNRLTKLYLSSKNGLKHFAQ